MGSINPSADEIRDEELDKLIGAGNLQLSRNFTIFPVSILHFSSTLRHLDLSNNPLLSSLPSSISQLTNLKIAFFSNCSFKTFPYTLAKCPSLEMIAFKSNGMTTIPEEAFPPKLRWLILTHNNIEKLPTSIGSCVNLTKCMLAGNALTDLPPSMRACRNLTLLRLARNNIIKLPSWLLTMPSLSFLGFAGNPCCPSTSTSHTPLPSVPWTSLQIGQVLGEGASGVISKAEWLSLSKATKPSHVAVKIFKGALTSDGSPADELSATIAAGTHTNLVSPLGLITSPRTGLVLNLIPPSYVNLGLPPTLESCVRDSFLPNATLSIKAVLRILSGVAAAAAHLHARGIMHGDLYAHNILHDPSGHALLSDFGAATVYASMEISEDMEWSMEQLEIRAFGYLVDDLLSLVAFDAAMIGEKEWSAVQEVRHLGERCVFGIVGARPLFTEVYEVLKGL